MNCRIVILLATVAGVSLPSLGCGERSPDLDERPVGVLVVENHQPARGPDEGWSIDPTPRLTLPVEPEVFFHQVASAVRLSDGSIWVADSGRDEILVFDPGGSLISILGGKGEGPGEFTSLASLVRLPGDTVVAWELSGRRRTTYTGEQRLVHTKQGVQARNLEGFVASPDGTIFGKKVNRGSATAPVGVRRADRFLVRATDQVDTLGVWPGREVLYVDVNGPFPEPVLTLFWPDTHIAGGGSPWRLVIGDGAQASFEVRTASGDLLRVVSWTPESRPLTAANIRTRRDWRLEDMVSTGYVTREVATLQLDALPTQTRARQFESLLVDETGHVWVKNSPIRPDGGEDWFVFDPTGLWLGEVRLPDNARPLVIGSDFMLAVRRDSLHVETVALFDLRR